MSDPTADTPSTADGKLPDTDTPPDAINLNVSGKELAGPERGFGQLWRKTYRISLRGSSATPQEVIRRWKTNFSNYWPEGSDFYGSRPRIEAGEVAVINLEAVSYTHLDVYKRQHLTRAGRAACCGSCIMRRWPPHGTAG